MFVKTVRSMSPGAWFALGLISLVIGFAGVYGWSYSQSQSGGSPTIEPLWEVIISVLVALGVALLLLLMNAGLTKLAYVSLNRGDEPTKLDRVLPKMMPKSVALFALILILFWSPYLVAVFPGVLYNDTTVQMQQVYEGAHPLNIRFGGNYQLGEEELEAAEKMNEYQKRSSVLSLTDAWLIDHHPFALTLFLGGIASLSDALFGNWMPALGFLMILQTILYASALSFAIAYVRKRGAPPSLCLAVLLFFCLFPAIPYFVGMIMKDCFFTFFCIPYLLMLAESVFTKGTFFRKKRAVAAFIIVALFLCLTKKTGVYIVGATALFGLIAGLVALGRAKRASGGSLGTGSVEASRATIWAFLLQGGISALLMFVIVPFCIFPALNIIPGSKAEALGFMFQQTTRSYVDHGEDSLTPQERAAIAEVMFVSGLEWDYRPKSADHAKIRVRAEMTDEQLRGYLGAYISMGLRYPVTYAEAIICTAAGYLAPVVPIEPAIHTLNWKLSFDGDRPVLWPLEATAEFRGFIQPLWKFLQDVPVVGLLFNGVTYALWIPGALLFFCLRNRLKGGILFVPFALVTFFCLIGPVYDLRYCLPEIFWAPILLAFLVALSKSIFKARADQAKALDVNKHAEDPRQEQESEAQQGAAVPVIAAPSTEEAPSAQGTAAPSEDESASGQEACVSS